ncbi:alpha/beta fold hydrolase [Streptomyces sp. NPDC007346]|uniref:alpha/beta fold hydrolase n=1 Tax=Streptomyces sp. NPDC007346 TaxID=3154682 RepID=UPI003452570E
MWTSGERDGKPLVLVHGIRVSASMWLPHARRIGPGYRIVACDLPGHGALRGQRFTLRGAVDRIGAAVSFAASGGRPVVLAGMSLGGYVSLAYAAEHPGTLGGLVLNNCTAQPRGSTVTLYRAAGRLAGWAGERWSDRVGAALLRKALPPESAEAVISGGLSMAGFSDSAREIPRHDFLAMAGRLTLPLLISNGVDDRLFRSDEDAFLAAARAAGARAALEHLPGSHLQSLTDPDRFTDLLRRSYRELVG